MFQLSPFSYLSNSKLITLKIVIVLGLILNAWPAIAKPTVLVSFTAVLQDIAADNAQETDTLEVDDQWRRIEFNSYFNNPVVIPIVETSNFNENGPFMIGIRNTDASGFEIRLEMCSNSSDEHIPEIINYTVIESGEYPALNGTQVEVKQRFLWGKCITRAKHSPDSL